MCPGYLRIRLPYEEALKRFAKSRGLAYPLDLVPCESSAAVSAACDKNGNWRGAAVYISDLGEWTLFYDLSGHLGGVAAEDWLKLAGNDELVFASYNDSISCGELVVIENGKVLREFLDISEDPDANVNRGKLDHECEPITSWIEVASFVDEDELGFSENGSLLIY